MVLGLKEGLECATECVKIEVIQIYALTTIKSKKNVSIVKCNILLSKKHENEIRNMNRFTYQES